MSLPKTSDKSISNTGIILEEYDLKTVERNLEKKIREFEILNDFGSKLSLATTVEEALYILGKQLQDLIENVGLLISCCDDPGIIRIKKTYGFNGSLLKIVQILGVNPTNIKIRIDELTESTLPLFTNGALNHLDEGLYPLFNGKVSKTSCSLTEQLLGIKEVETMGFAVNGKPRGGVSLLLRKESVLDNRSLVESIIKQAATTIDRLQVLFELKESEKKYRELIEKADVAVAIDDPEGDIVFFNPEFAKLFGYPQSEMRGKSINDLIHPEDLEWIKPIHNKRYAGDKVSDNYEFRGIKKNGKLIWISLKTGLYVKHGSIRGTRTYFWDITERKLNEITLENAKEKAEESDRLKSSFLRNLSHEIRTPLNGVLGFSSLLDDPGLDRISRSEYLKIINESGEQLSKIMDDVMDISKLESGQVKVEAASFELNQIVRTLKTKFESKCSARQLDFRIIIHPHVPEKLKTDYYKAVQIIEILVSNAIKFTSAGHIYVNISPNDNDSERIRFEIEDTGIGIAPEFHKSIFERFRKGTEESSILNGGTGLGLSIAKGMVHLLGGEIGVTSKKHEGSRFFFTLPSVV